MTRADGADPVIALRHATVGYHDRPVLRDISLTVARGEVLAILGANGSGKSTLVRALLGLLPLAAGTLTLFGRPLAGPAPGRRGRFRQWHRIGYVPQRLGAGSGVPATVAEVVASGRLARRGRLRLWLPRRSGAGGGAAPAAGSRRGTDRSGVAAAIESVGLTSRRHDPVSTLSGGQQQRVLIARALAAEPDLLVLDEPTAGVDAASQQSFADTVRRFVAGGGTAVLVAHELGPMSELVSRAVVLHHGELVHDGPVPEPAGHHARPGHDHVHPHAPTDPPGLWHEGLPR